MRHHAGSPVLGTIQHIMSKPTCKPGAYRDWRHMKTHIGTWNMLSVHARIPVPQTDWIHMQTQCNISAVAASHAVAHDLLITTILSQIHPDLLRGPRRQRLRSHGTSTALSGSAAGARHLRL